VSRAERFEPLPPETAERWAKFGRDGAELYVSLLGLQVEELRAEYCRMRMPWKPSLDQAAGVVHGGAIAGLLDSVVVPVVGAPLPRDARFSTIDFHVQYLSALVKDDAIAEGWTVKRGRSVVFCEAEVVAASTGKVIATASLTYSVSLP
jgi:uncharacterized protein (TIGR00369 family)